MKSLKLTICALAVLALGATASGQAVAQDKVSVGVFPLSSSLPYFVALERGFFKEQNIEPEMNQADVGGPSNVAAMMTNQIEVSVVLVTLEGLNANVKKPGVAMYISLNSQTKVWKMEQFVVRNGFKAETIADLKGAKLMSAPGPANLNTAKAILAKNGLKDGDYTIDQLDMSQQYQRHDGRNLRRRLYAGAQRLDDDQGRRGAFAGGRRVISKYILGDESADAYAAGLRDDQRFHPEAARGRQALRRGVEQGHRFRQQES